MTQVWGVLDRAHHQLLAVERGRDLAATLAHAARAAGRQLCVVKRQRGLADLEGELAQAPVQRALHALGELAARAIPLAHHQDTGRRGRGCSPHLCRFCMRRPRQRRRGEREKLRGDEHSHASAQPGIRS
jgi:hypothetical protein